MYIYIYIIPKYIPYIFLVCCLTYGVNILVRMSASMRTSMSACPRRSWSLPAFPLGFMRKQPRPLPLCSSQKSSMHLIRACSQRMGVLWACLKSSSPILQGSSRTQRQQKQQHRSVFFLCFPPLAEVLIPSPHLYQHRILQKYEIVKDIIVSG